MEKKVTVNVKSVYAGDKDFLDVIVPAICEALRKDTQEGRVDESEKPS